MPSLGQSSLIVLCGIAFLVMPIVSEDVNGKSDDYFEDNPPDPQPDLISAPKMSSSLPNLHVQSVSILWILQLCDRQSGECYFLNFKREAPGSYSFTK